MRPNNAVSPLISAIIIIVGTGCGDSKAPTETESETPKETRAISVALCGLPTWAAHLDEGGKWTRVSIISGKAVFQGTEKQGLAVVASDQGAISVDVIYTTATTLSALTCGGPSIGDKTINGTVANLGSLYANVSLGDAIGFAGFTGSNFTLYNVADGALDLVATRSSGAFGDGAPDRMIVRRAQTLAAGSTIALDFDASESFALESHTLAVTGAGSDAVMLGHIFRSAAGTLHLMQFGNDAAAPTMLVPASQLAAGDLHLSSALASSAHGSRAASLYYKDPVDKTLSIGPAIGAPTVTTLAPSPSVRLRAEMAAPAEYGAGAAVSWEQDVGTHRSYSVALLKDYLGAMPAKWTLDMPDLSKAPGFNGGWGLTQGSYEWTAQLIDGSVEALIGDKPKDGDMLRIATQTSAQSALVAGAPLGNNLTPGMTRPIPRLFGRMR